MIWTSWRLQRSETLIAVGILAALGLFVVPTGLQMAGAYHHDGLAACVGQSPAGGCEAAVQSFIARFNSLMQLVAWVTILPGLIGVLLAAPFALELENGTYRFAWTQSITRRRWIAGKLGLAIAAALVAALVLTALMTWWRAPWVHLQGRMDASVYDSQGIVVFGYTLFALGLALAVGAIWRRAVPALVVAFAGYMAARIFFDTWVRQRLLAPLQITWPTTKPDPSGLHHAWVLTQSPSDRFGHPARIPFGACFRGLPHIDRAPSPRCLALHGAGFNHAVYEPASRFWPLQGIETGIFGGVALVLILLAAWWTHERTA